MTILSFDMSTTSTGWCLMNNDKSILNCGVFKANKSKDIYERIYEMKKHIDDLFKNYTIDFVVYEEVPVSQAKNLNTAKFLCVLQGCLLASCFENKVQFISLRPNEWREWIGLHKTLYHCLSCGNQFEDISNINHPVCPKCEEKRIKYFKRTGLNDRASLKIRAVNMANDIFHLSLSEKDDDVAEAILIGRAFVERMNNCGIQ